jgi:Helicase associated domain
MQVNQLTAAGFHFETAKIPSFEERLDMIKAFKAVHNHTRIPQTYNEPQGIGRWIRNIKRQYRAKKLHPERVGK